MKNWKPVKIPITYATGKPKIVIQRAVIPVRRSKNGLSRGAIKKINQAINSRLPPIHKQPCEPSIYQWAAYPWLT